MYFICVLLYRKRPVATGVNRFPAVLLYFPNCETGNRKNPKSGQLQPDRRLHSVASSPVSVFFSVHATGLADTNPILSYPILSYLILSYLILFYFISIQWTPMDSSPLQEHFTVGRIPSGLQVDCPVQSTLIIEEMADLAMEWVHWSPYELHMEYGGDYKDLCDMHLWMRLVLI